MGTAQRSSASGSTVWFVKPKVRHTVAHAASQPSPSSSSRMRSSSGMAMVGCVSFSCTATRWGKAAKSASAAARALVAPALPPRAPAPPSKPARRPTAPPRASSSSSLKRPTASCSDALTKKYCWRRRNLRPLSVESSGYTTAVSERARSASPIAASKSPTLNAAKSSSRTGSADQSRMSDVVVVA